MGEEERAAIIAEVERGLDTLRVEMAEAIRHGDRDLYVSLANRYGKLNQRWASLQRPQVGPGVRLTDPEPTPEELRRAAALARRLRDPAGESGRR